MYLEIDENVQNKINNLKGNKDGKLIFDTDDGAGPFSIAGTCSLGTHFRLLIVDPGFESDIYNGIMDSNIGQLPFKDYSRTYLSDKMKLSLENGKAVLKSDYENIDLSFEIKDFRNK
ncbi:hypothetical protein BG261_09115 [Floricoccus tropicus]|uniref:Core domain-containing protein n=1 Tax=Floricoccus tropicus TaxID=1859473 RepID=A0A1E8GS05_9LACT|nr:iron-sulfur cluster biosynthesis family protein [Floricoccus tropicus]OFI50268.1 hypothetical protein BG261_09115 [Floricoccus tropicus]